MKREDGSLIFVEPYETSEAFGDFLEYVRADSDTPASEHENLVKYAQTRPSTFLPIPIQPY